LQLEIISDFNTPLKATMSKYFVNAMSRFINSRIHLIY
jgi:hypothetical protein